MQKNKRLHHDIGAKISVYKTFLHTRADVCAKYQNASKNGVLVDLLTIGQEEKLVSKQEQGFFWTQNANFDDGQILHNATCYC